MSLFAPTRNEMVAEIERELEMRRRVYSDRVSTKKMSQAKADRQIAVMEAVRDEIKRGYPIPPGISPASTALVLYFTDKNEAYAFVELCKEARPGMASYHVP